MQTLKLIVLFILIQTSLLTAQDKANLSLTIGPSIPFGDFSSTNWKNNDAGFAKMGFQYAISYQHKLISKLGIIASLRGEANPVDAQKIAEGIASQNPGVNVTVESKPWASGAIMIGAYLSLPLSEKIAVEPRFLIGFASSISSETKINGSGSSINNYSVKTKSENASASAILVGLSVNYKISKRLSFLIDGSYYTTEPKFEDVVTTSSIGENYIDTFKQSISTASFSIGLALRFNNKL